MISLGVLCLVVTGAFAVPADVPAVESPPVPPAVDTPGHVRCSLSVVHGVVVDGAEKALYMCSSDGDTGHFLLFADSVEPTLEAVVAKDAFVNLQEVTRTPKRRGGYGGFGGFGGGGGFANSQASAGSFGGGFGRPGYGGGGGFANSQASAGGFGFGG